MDILTSNPARPLRTVSLELRAEICALIDSAARMQGKTRSAFIIDAAHRLAEDAMLDQALVRVDRASYDRFAAILDHPASGAGIARLMDAPGPWGRCRQGVAGDGGLRD